MFGNNDWSRLTEETDNDPCGVHRSPKWSSRAHPPTGSRFGSVATRSCTRKEPSSGGTGRRDGTPNGLSCTAMLGLKTSSGRIVFASSAFGPPHHVPHITPASNKESKSTIGVSRMDLTGLHLSIPIAQKNIPSRLRSRRLLAELQSGVSLETSKWLHQARGALWDPPVIRQHSRRGPSPLLAMPHGFRHVRSYFFFPHHLLPGVTSDHV